MTSNKILESFYSNLDVLEKNKTMFLDSEFSAGPSIISKTNKSLTKDLSFVRLKECPALAKLILLRDQTHPASLTSQLIKHSSFVDALRIISLFPVLLRKLIINKEINQCGMYSVAICDNGEWKLVIVDDHFPINKKGNPAFLNSDLSELWPFLIEKAYAKNLGSYEQLSNGIFEEILRDLTGCSYEKISSENDFNLFWRNITKATQEKKMVTCYATRKNSERNEGSALHMIIEVKQSPKKVLVRNLTKSDPAFWIDSKDILSNYSYFCAISINETFIYESIQITQKDHETSTPFRIKVDTPVDICFSLNQRDLKSLNSKPSGGNDQLSFEESALTLKTSRTHNEVEFSPGLSISNFDLDDYKYSMARLVLARVEKEKLIFISASNGKMRNLQLEHHLEPGNYIALAEIHWNTTITRTFTFSYYSSSNIQIKTIKDFELQTFTKNVIKDIAESKYLLIGSQTIYDYEEKEIPDIQRMVGEGIGLYWIYYQNQNPTIELEEEITYKMNSVQLNQPNQSMLDISPKTSGVQNKISIKISPNSEQLVLFKAHDQDPTFECEFISSFKEVRNPRSQKPQIYKDEPRNFVEIEVDSLFNELLNPEFELESISSPIKEIGKPSKPMLEKNFSFGKSAKLKDDSYGSTSSPNFYTEGTVQSPMASKAGAINLVIPNKFLPGFNLIAFIKTITKIKHSILGQYFSDFVEAVSSSKKMYYKLGLIRMKKFLVLYKKNVLYQVKGERLSPTRKVRPNLNEALRLVNCVSETNEIQNLWRNRSNFKTVMERAIRIKDLYSTLDRKIRLRLTERKSYGLIKILQILEDQTQKSNSSISTPKGDANGRTSRMASSVKERFNKMFHKRKKSQGSLSTARNPNSSGPSPMKNISQDEDGDRANKLSQLLSKRISGHKKVESYLRYEHALYQITRIINGCVRRELTESFEYIQFTFTKRARVLQFLKNNLLIANQK